VMLVRMFMVAVGFTAYLLPLSMAGAVGNISEATQECLGCHNSVTPAIVAGWKKGLHAQVTPSEALKKPKLKRRMSANKVPDNLANVVVGCAECHALNPNAHTDVFDHSDRKVHVTVTPQDCAVCHPDERAQYRKNLMSHAWTNLASNPLYRSLEKAVNGLQTVKGVKTVLAKPDALTSADSCYFCHGTEVKVTGKKKKDTDWGTVELVELSGWPNEGVGRKNPDGTQGTCTPCHSRHEFSIEQARKPYTCSQCHKGPDVVAYDAYSVSKHGNLFFSLQAKWNFNEVPWTVGKDFSAPTCASCHAALLVNKGGDVIAERTHEMADRIPWRIFGLIYAHPHPLSPDTSVIRSEDGLPLPTSLDGQPAKKYLISAEEQATRRQKLEKVCSQCHVSDVVKGHWERFENTIKSTNAMTLTSTRILQKAWDAKVADRSSMFDESIEKQWMQEWFFYANSTRFASAMLGADYGAFADGRWYLAKTIQDMLDHLQILMAVQKGK
jgi:hydroxylamine dehydrogenase